MQLTLCCTSWYDHSSLPAKHTDDNGHKFDWSHTKCPGQATTKYAREFKEEWHCLDKQTLTLITQLKKRSNNYKMSCD